MESLKNSKELARQEETKKRVLEVGLTLSATVAWLISSFMVVAPIPDAHAFYLEHRGALTLAALIAFLLTAAIWVYARRWWLARTTRAETEDLVTENR